MAEIANPVRDRLAKGELALGVGLRQARTVDIAMAMKTCDFDWLFIDLEHNSMDIDMAAQISVAALGAGIAPLVRVPGGDYGMAARALDNGALGIVMPHIDTVDQARELAERLRYPPLGRRSISGAIPQFRFAPGNLSDAVAALNRATLVVAMIETPKAIERVDEIAAVDGIDVVMIGTNDLSAEFGCTGDFDDPRIADAYEKTIAACARHKIWPGMGGVYADAQLERFVGMGMRFILSGNDISFLLSGAKARTGALRQIRSR